MRGVLVLGLLLTACSEPSFDEQYEKNAAEIRAETRKVENELKAQIELVPEAAEAADPEKASQ